MAAVDRYGLPGNPRGSLGDEELHAVDDVRRLSQPPHGDARHQLPLALLAVALPLPLGRRIGADEARSDAVDRDAERPELVRHLPGEPDLGRLRAGVCLDPRLADAPAGCG